MTAVLPVSIGDRVSGAHDLRDVVNGGAEHDAGGLRIETEPDANQRIGHHRHCRERIDCNYDESDVGFLAFIVRQDDRRRERRGCAAYRRSRGSQCRICRLQVQGADNQEAGGQRCRHRHDDQDRRGPPQRGNVAERNAQAEQRHRPAQNDLEAEDDAGLK